MRSPHSAETDHIAGIEQASAPCFYPEDQDGQAFEWGDGTPHWTTASEAHRMMFAIRRDDRGVDIRLRRETAPCWHVACDECGYRYDEDEWCCHFLGREDAEAAARDSDWHVADGRLLCSECYLTDLSNPPGNPDIPLATEDGIFRNTPPGQGSDGGAA